MSVLEVRKIMGVPVPRFYYFERLAGNCKICVVELKKAPKSIASCAFPVVSNKRIEKNTQRVQKIHQYFIVI
jgi:NADH dehydrogenase/NADH:ubiquinone oxidoreductase subunit G